MKLNDAIARLQRAGDRNSRSWQKLREAVDEFADWLAKIYPGGGEMSTLSMNYRFTHWPSGEYSLIKVVLGVKKVELTRKSKDPADLFAFAQDIDNGFLDRLTEILEGESIFLESAASKLNNRSHKTA